MRPDKLFDYLEGKLPDWERAELEKQLATEPRLRDELAMARRIHSHSGGESREVLIADEEASARGRKMALRVGIAFIVLIALNVGLGLLFIARKEASNPNRQLLDKQMREQLTKSLQQAAHAALTPPPLDVVDIGLTAAAGRLDFVADQVVAIAQRLGGSATKELPDNHRLGVLVDLTAARETEFRAALATIAGGAPPLPSATPENTADTGRKSFVIHVTEAGAP